MRRFDDAREAKTFLVGKIVAEAQREGEPLSQVEEKMLYFSETGWTLPEMESVSAAFDREYNEVEYEHRVASLIRKLRAGTGRVGTDDGKAWDAAVRLLRREDHYLIVIVDIAESSFAIPKRRETMIGERSAGGRRWMTLVAYGTGAAFVLFVAGYFIFGMVNR